MIARSYCDETLPNSRRQTVDLNESNETETVSNTITKLLLKHSYPLSSPGSNRKRKRKHGVYVWLPDDVKAARSQRKTAFDHYTINKINLLTVVLYMITIGQNAKIIAWLCVNF